MLFANHNATGVPARRFDRRVVLAAAAVLALALTFPLLSSAALSGTPYVSDLTWTAMTNGWGPAEKDMSNGENAASDGRSLSINGVKYAKGLGVHAPSDIRYALGATCSAFTAVVGIDDEAGTAASVVFQVYKDSVKIYESPLMRKGSAIQNLNLPVTGANELRLVVTDGGDGTNSDHADWANASLACATPAPTPSGTYLSDLKWSTVANGWGPAEKDLSNGEIAAGDGHAISINGVKYTKGIGVHAPADLRYTMSGTCSVFTSDFGVDDESRPNGSVIFQVWADGSKLYDSGLVTGTGAAKSVSVNVSGKNELQLLVTDGGNGSANDHADWANAKIACTTPAPTPAQTSSTAYLSDLNWRTVANGWGPAEKDLSNGEIAAGDGHVISINSVKYTKGIGVHAPADVRYTMSGACSAFTSDFGVDDEARPNGSVIFQVWADGSKLYDSGLVTGTGAAKSLNVSVAGKNELQLVVTDGGNGNANDHADWANARLTCSSTSTSTVTPPPAVTQPPVVSAGAALSVTLPGSATLNGTATDDGLPNKTLTTTWSLVSGPAAMTFNPPTSLNSIASFTTAGTYTLKLTVSDGSLSASSSVQVTVSPAVVTPPTQPPATTGTVLYPTDAGILNVKTTYGAKGDGVTDDTQALRGAIRDFYAKYNSTNVRYGFLYFPDGTYLISDTLDWKDSNGAWHGYLAFRGQSQAGTIIKLKDNASGFGNPSTPKAVLYTASEQADGNRADGGGDEAFRDGLFDLTVDTGKGNPGATGVNYVGSNQSVVRRITIRSGDRKGVAGLDISRPYTGPELFRDMTIVGFDNGIVTGYPLASATFEHITLQNQNLNGIVNSENVISIRDLTSINTVPAIKNDQFPAALTLVDAKLTGGNGGAAIVNSGSAIMYLRNITTSGYTSAANNNGTSVTGPNITEFVSNPVASLFPTPTTSMNLPVQETPEFQDSDMSNWANVKSYGAVPNDYSDDRAAIQAAIDSGKSTVYFPAGAYLLNDSVHIRGNVKRIVAYGALLSPVNGSCPAATGHPAFIFDGATANTVIVEDLTFIGNWQVAVPGPEFSFPMLYHTGPQTVVLRNIMSTHYRNAAGSGPVFLENVCCGPFEFNNTSVWARQLDPELTGTHVTNNGSNLWILGLKTEGLGTIINTTGGGKTELLGAYISLQQLSSPTATPGFINNESNHSLVYVTDTDHNFTNSIQETRNGVTKNIGPSSLPARYKGSNVPLYVGYK